MAALFLILFQICWKEPEQVYVNRGLAERFGDFFTVEEGQEWNRKNSLFLGDMSPGEDVYELRGNILSMERIRGEVSAAVWGAAAGMAAGMGWQTVRRTRGRHG